MMLAPKTFPVALGRKTRKETDDARRGGLTEAAQCRGSPEQGAKLRITFHTVSLSTTLSECETNKKMQHPRSP